MRQAVKHLERRLLSSDWDNSSLDADEIEYCWVICVRDGSKLLLAKADDEEASSSVDLWTETCKQQNTNWVCWTENSEARLVRRSHMLKHEWNFLDFGSHAGNDLKLTFNPSGLPLLWRDNASSSQPNMEHIYWDSHSPSFSWLCKASEKTGFFQN